MPSDDPADDAPDSPEPAAGAITAHEPFGDLPPCRDCGAWDWSPVGDGIVVFGRERVAGVFECAACARLGVAIMPVSDADPAHVPTEFLASFDV